MRHIQPSFRVYNKTVRDRASLRWQIECGCRLLLNRSNREINRARRVWLRRNLKGFVPPQEIENANAEHLATLGEGAIDYLRSELHRLEPPPKPSAVEAAAIARARAEPVNDLRSMQAMLNRCYADPEFATTVGRGKVPKPAPRRVFRPVVVRPPARREPVSRRHLARRARPKAARAPPGGNDDDDSDPDPDGPPRRQGGWP